MTVSELKRILEAEGFRQDVYSLTLAAFRMRPIALRTAVTNGPSTTPKEASGVGSGSSSASRKLPSFLAEVNGCRRDPTTKPRH